MLRDLSQFTVGHSGVYCTLYRRLRWTALCPAGFGSRLCLGSCSASLIRWIWLPHGFDRKVEVDRLVFSWVFAILLLLVPVLLSLLALNFHKFCRRWRHRLVRLP